MKRNIYNNPSGKPYCCHVDCNEDATKEIRYSNELEDYTHSCDRHIKLLTTEIENPIISFINAPTYINGVPVKIGDKVEYKDMPFYAYGNDMKISGEAIVVFKESDFYLEVMKDSAYTTFDPLKVKLLETTA